MENQPNTTIFIDVGTGAEPYILQAEFPPGLHDAGPPDGASTIEPAIELNGAHRNANKYTCSICKYTTSEDATFKEHLKDHTKLTCKTCGFQCSTKRDLMKHEKGHRSKASRKQAKDAKPTKMQKGDKYRCAVCSVRCRTPDGLSIHNELCRTLDEPFSCALCEWKSNLHAQVLLHLIQHSNQAVNDKVINVTILRKHGVIN